MSLCIVCGDHDHPSWACDWPVPFKVCSNACVDLLEEENEDEQVTDIANAVDCD